MDGRLISEADGLTGETLRDYVWLGLMPIAVIDAGEDAPDTACEADVAALQAEIAAQTAQMNENAEGVAALFDLIGDRETLILENDAFITRQSNLSVNKEGRIASIDNRIAELNGFITNKDTTIAANAASIAELNVLIATDEAELAGLDPSDDAAQFTLVSARIAANTQSVATISQENDRLAQINAFHAGRISALTAWNSRLEGLKAKHDARVARTALANEALEVLITEHEADIDALSQANFALAEQIAQLEADLADAEANCGLIAVEVLYYLHADHLGRPQFATDTSGAVVWDMGEGVTPFGDSVNLAGAFAQQLMFPGQYADVETGGEGDDVTLSHNWHRTYDPTLGRYLQSDPIGLAGGLNLYAYVGGNPVGYVDPTGEFGIVGGFLGLGGNLAWQLFRNGGRLECVDWADVAISGVSGALGPGLGTVFKSAKAWHKASKIAKTSAKKWIYRQERNIVVAKFAINKAASKYAKDKIDFQLCSEEKCKR